jgi:prepilin-type processing-associated H-X9-DG protein
MPIAYACPHCGKQYSVADQYAGQTGPCANCGQTITIPLAGGVLPAAPLPAAGPAGSGAGGGSDALVALVVALVLGLVMLLACGGVLVALLLPAVQAAREAARRVESSNNLKQIGLALHNYHDVYGTLPPAVVTDANGKALYSGRVLLLPFLEQQALYDAFAKDQPWNSPQNLPISSTTLKVFTDPSDLATTPGQTSYLFVSGPGAMFETGKTIALRDILDGTVNTAAVIEVHSSGIVWSEPRDLDPRQAAPLPKGSHPGGNIVLMADGSVRFVSQAVAPGTMQAMTTRAGGETVQLP